MSGYLKILHPTDFSPCSEQALKIAMALAHEGNGTLILLHVVPPVPVVTGTGPQQEVERQEKMQYDRALYKEEMRTKLNQIPVLQENLEVERDLEEGDVANAIVQFADRKVCDLIVMGTHGYGEKFRKLMGSVAESVNEMASCPVLTFHSPQSRSWHEIGLQPEMCSVR